ncbi:MAG: TldD/PmbA family protein [Myxococcales bacterium]
MSKSLVTIAEQAVERARRRGARQADAWAELSRESSVRVRDGEVETLEGATSKGLGLRVIAAGRLGFAYTSDLTPASLDALVDRAVSLARSSAPDPANRLPGGRAFAERHGDLGLLDPAVVELSTSWKIEAAKTMERVGRSIDRHVKAFESVGASDVVAEVAIASSEGLSDSYRSSYVALYSAPVAQADDGQLQTGYWVDYRRFLNELETPEAVGRKAAERALRMLGAGKGPTRRVPVIFEPLQAAAFFGGLAGALDGKRIHQKASFLAGKLGQRIAPGGLSLVDDGLHLRGLGSRPFDGEGLPTRRTALVDRGVLASYLYDTYTAHKAKAKSTATASRGYQSLPHIGTTTLLVEAAATVPAGDILRGVKEGLYVTSMLGHGADTVTGDYSQGAAGLWIENGELTRPVQAMTVAGNLLDMLSSIDAVGDDLDLRGTVGAPTVRFAELTVAG